MLYHPIPKLHLVQYSDMSPEHDPVRVPEVYHVDGQFKGVADALPPMAKDVIEDYDDC